MNLRQYRRSEIVQAAEVLADTSTDQVRVADAYGGAVIISAGGLGQAGGALAGDWMILYPTGKVAKMSAEDFAAAWEPCGGAILS